MLIRQVGVQEASAAAEATIQTLRAELADSHRAESAAQEASWQAGTDLSQVPAWLMAGACAARL